MSNSGADARSPHRKLLRHQQVARLRSSRDQHQRVACQGKWSCKHPVRLPSPINRHK